MCPHISVEARALVSGGLMTSVDLNKLRNGISSPIPHEHLPAAGTVGSSSRKTGRGEETGKDRPASSALAGGRCRLWEESVSQGERAAQGTGRMLLCAWPATKVPRTCHCISVMPQVIPTGVQLDPKPKLEVVKIKIY